MENKINENPLVSIIINNFNYSRYIAEAIQSALDQSYPKTEIIVVDDGSTDSSRDIINSYLKFYPNRIIPIYKENGGQASAMNTGFNASNGEIICFLDSDDYWFGHKVSSVIEPHRNFGLVQHNLLQNGRRYRLLINTGDLQHFLREFGLIRSCVPTSGLSFRRDILEKIFPLPEESLKLCADVYLRCASVYHSMAYSIDKCLGVYRLHGNNGWHDNMRFTNPNIANDIVDVLNRDLADKGYSSIPKKKDSRELAFLNSIDVKRGMTYLLYGAGDYGVKLGRKIESIGGKVSAFCDDTKSKWGRTAMGRIIHSPEELSELRQTVNKIVISCICVERVFEKLTDMGLRHPDDFLVPIDLEGHVTASQPNLPERLSNSVGHCPICEKDVNEWKPFTRKVADGQYCEEPGGRLCPHCSSFERTRHFWLYITKTEILKSKPKMLHVAPETGLQKRLKAILGNNYSSVDISMESADTKASLTELPFADDCFGFIYCSNVLEHITNDKEAMQELSRVLVPGGAAYIQVPVIGENTKEDYKVTDPAERTRLYGQADHVRQYGRDIKTRLSQIGFEVLELIMPDVMELSEYDVIRFNCKKRELIHLCTKPDS